MAFGAYVQSTGKKEASVTSSALAFGSNNTAGNSIQVAVYVSDIGRTVTVSDSKSNTYIQDATKETNTAFPWGIYVFSAHNIGAGANTVTAGISGAAATIRFAIWEHEGDMVADKTASAQDTSASPPLTVDSGNTAATTDAAEVIFGACATEGQTFGITAGSGFSHNTTDQQEGSFDVRLSSESKLVAATGTYNATFAIDPAQARPRILELAGKHKSVQAFEPEQHLHLDQVAFEERFREGIERARLAGKEEPKVN